MKTLEPGPYDRPRREDLDLSSTWMVDGSGTAVSSALQMCALLMGCLATADTLTLSPQATDAGCVGFTTGISALTTRTPGTFSTTLTGLAILP